MLLPAVWVDGAWNLNAAAKQGLYPPGGLLTLCLELHGHMTGSSEYASYLQLRRWRTAIQLAVDTWSPSPPFSQAFDDAVKSVCLAVLAEANEPKNAWQFPEPVI